MTRPRTRRGAPPPSRPLSRGAKCVYALGDFSGNTVLASLSLIYASYFLISVAELRPALAGLVPLVGRAVDAVTDPLMGRLSDHTRWRWGRRRPYFLIGAVPLAMTFALLWVDAPASTQLGKFAYYTALYCLLTTALTVVAVPHLALQPEMVLDYDERTSLTTYRNVAATLGIVAAIAIRPVADTLGGGFAGYTAAGAIFGVLVGLPWLGVWAVSFEREDFRTRPTRLGIVEGLRVIARHRNFRVLVGLYLTGRMSMDLIGAMLILYFTHYLGRSGDFELAMLLFLPAAALSLPMWLHLSRSSEKVTIFRIGCAWWMAAQALLFLARPDWPHWVILVFAPLSAVGYAVVDLMPWSMVGDVIDEDDLATGERREGVYHGVFLFLRKLGGAVGVFLALGVLDVAGLSATGEQSPRTREAIRWMASVAPALCLLLAMWLSRGYALTRAEHARVRDVLVARATGESRPAA